MKKNTLLFLFLLYLSSLYSQSTESFSLKTNQPVGSSIAFTVNSGARLTVDWGDGITEEFISTVDSVAGILRGNTVVVTGTNICMLDCSNQSITELNVTGLPYLTTLYCSSNQLTALELSANTQLCKLNCSHNALTSLSTLTNPKLTDLLANNNNLSQLQYCNTSVLNTLVCNDNQLLTLSTNGLSGLKTLWCQNNSIETIDIQQSKLLETLICYNNKVKDLNVNGLTLLSQLWCDYNQVPSLNLSTNTALKYLSANNATISNITYALPIGIQAMYVNDNNLGYAGLPYSTSISNYNYAPQNKLLLPVASTLVVDLSAQLRTANGSLTNARFDWFNGNTQLQAGNDYSEQQGVFTFTKPFNEAYCVISSSVFQQLPSISTTTTQIGALSAVEDKYTQRNLIVSKNNIGLHIQSLEEQNIVVRNISGTEVKKITKFIGEITLQLPAGVYLVNRQKIIL